MLKNLSSIRRLNWAWVLCFILYLPLGSSIAVATEPLLLESSFKVTGMTGVLLAKGQITEDQAIQIAQQQVSGKVLDVKLDHAQNIYRVKILSADAKVQVVKIDSNTGKAVR